MKKAKRMKRVSVFMRLYNAMEKHFFKIIIACGIIIIAIPIAVWLCYSVLPPVITTDISADGILSYFGGVIGSFVTLLVAFLAVYQSKKQMEVEEDQQEQQRREEIKPVLTVELLECGDCFELVITNNGLHSAINVYIYDKSILPQIKAQDSRKKMVIFNEKSSNPEALSIYGFDIETNVDGYPNEITLIYADIDNDIITAIYKCYCEGNAYHYELTELSY